MNSHRHTAQFGFCHLVRLINKIGTAYISLPTVGNSKDVFTDTNCMHSTHHSWFQSVCCVLHRQTWPSPRHRLSASPSPRNSTRKPGLKVSTPNCFASKLCVRNLYYTVLFFHPCFTVIVAIIHRVSYLHNAEGYTQSSLGHLLWWHNHSCRFFSQHIKGCNEVRCLLTQECLGLTEE